METNLPLNKLSRGDIWLYSVMNIFVSPESVFNLSQKLIAV